MSNNDKQNGIIKNLRRYLNNLNVVHSGKIINNFLKSFSNYLSKCGQILYEIEQSGQVYNLRLQNKLISETDIFLLSAFKLENMLPLEAKIKIRDLYRGVVGKYLFQSKILKRFYDKPRGYAGDYLMFEMMYDEKPLSRGIGIYFDHYVFRHPIVTSVFKRKDKMKKVLKNILTSEFQYGQSVKILNIGCGGAREVKELFTENNFSANIQFTLMDQDKEGLNYAQSSLKSLEKKNLKFSFVERNALEIIGFSKRQEDKNSYDVIYSLGIVDYFFDNVFSHFIKHCYGLLKTNGRLIIAACSNRVLTSYIALRWLSEWHFYYRDAKLVKSLINGVIEKPSVEIIWEDKKQIFFINITKK